MGRRRQRLCFARVPPVHLGPGRPAGDRDQEKPSARGLPRVDLQQSQPRRAPVGAPQGRARRRNPLRENRPILHGRALSCRHLRLDQERLQAITGPSTSSFRDFHLWICSKSTKSNERPTLMQKTKIVSFFLNFSAISPPLPISYISTSHLPTSSHSSQAAATPAHTLSA